ncbi:MAG: PH domain-containing protein [Bacillota bacterium]
MAMLAPVLLIAFAVISTGNIQPVLVGLPLALLMAWFWWGTGYTFIGENLLKIACGPFCDTIDVDSIIAVQRSHAPWSSAALSVDRLKLTTSLRGWSRVWYISPEDKDGFLLELMRRNPRILV